MIDHEPRPLFAFFGALHLPLGVHAQKADYDDRGIPRGARRERVGRVVDAAIASVSREPVQQR
ncbi:hypothetical protein AAIB33_00875 [Microbacterium sp. AZCO]|uniref:hypothetical protein n=1 Tax=Microbacterium sp. AZCO TaxID=3142976 RepID=UPI0031F34D0A